MEELEGIRAALESQIDKQTAEQVNDMKEQLAQITAQKDKTFRPVYVRYV